jgi:hypothetical protein
MSGEAAEDTAEDLTAGLIHLLYEMICATWQKIPWKICILSNPANEVSYLFPPDLSSLAGGFELP